MIPRYARQTKSGVSRHEASSPSAVHHSSRRHSISSPVAGGHHHHHHRRSRRRDGEGMSTHGTPSTDAACSTESEKRTLKLGCRVDVVDKRGRPRRLDCGVLRYLGPTGFGSGRQAWCGLELDAAIGKHDGSVDGIRYFTCPKDRGLFVPVELCLNCRDPEARIAASAQTPSQPTSNEQDATRSKSSEFAQYLKMIDFGVPKSAVLIKMIADGIEEGEARRELFGDERRAEREKPAAKTNSLFRPLHWDGEEEEVFECWNIQPQDLAELVVSFGKDRVAAPTPSSPVRSSRRSALDGRRAMNVSIMLGKLVGTSSPSLAPSYRALAEALCLRNRKLTPEQLELLLAVAPTREERNALATAADQWGMRPETPAELALTELAAIPRCLQVVKAELLASTFRSRLAIVSSDAAVRCDACRAILRSSSLRRFLAAVSAIASAMRHGPARPTKRVALGSMLSLMRAKGSCCSDAEQKSTFCDVVVTILADRHDFEPLFSWPNRLRGLKSSRGEPRELSLAVSAVADALKDARALASAEIDDERRLDADAAAKAVEAAFKAISERAEREARELERKRARERAAMARNDVSDQERTNLLARRAQSHLEDAFEALQTLRQALKKSPQPASPSPSSGKTPINSPSGSAQSTPTNFRRSADPQAWASKRKEAVERAAALRALRNGTALPEDFADEIVSPRQQAPSVRKVSSTRRGIPERVTAACDAGNLSPAVMRAAAAWASWVVATPPSKLPRAWPELESFALSSALAAASRRAWQRAARKAREDDSMPEPPARTQPPPPVASSPSTTKPTGRFALLSAIGGGGASLLRKRKPSHERMQKSQHVSVEAMAARSRSYSRDIVDIDDALDAAEAAIVAARALGEDCRRFLASGNLSTDASIATVTELARLVASSVERCAIVAPTRRASRQPRCGDSVLTPYGFGRVDSLRGRDNYQRVVVTIPLVGQAFLRPSCVVRPPCRAQTPYGPGYVVEQHDRQTATQHWHVKFSWGAGAVRHSDLRWLPRRSGNLVRSSSGSNSHGSSTVEDMEDEEWEDDDTDTTTDVRIRLDEEDGPITTSEPTVDDLSSSSSEDDESDSDLDDLALPSFLEV